MKKEQVATAKSADKAHEIAEGLKLSRRVDGLREMAAKEETTLENFRKQTLENIQKEIDVLVAKKQALLDEIASIEKDLKQETTLTRKERLNLELLKAELIEKEKGIKEQQEKLAFEEIDLAILKKNLDDSLARAVSREAAAVKLHASAEYDREKMAEARAEAQMIEERTMKKEKATTDKLILWEKRLSSRDSFLEEQEASLDKKTKELEGEKLRVIDREKTLERELERIRQNRL